MTGWPCLVHPHGQEVETGQSPGHLHFHLEGNYRKFWPWWPLSIATLCLLDVGIFGAFNFSTDSLFIQAEVRIHSKSTKKYSLILQQNIQNSKNGFYPVPRTGESVQIQTKRLNIQCQISLTIKSSTSAYGWRKSSQKRMSMLLSQKRMMSSDQEYLTFIEQIR